MTPVSGPAPETVSGEPLKSPTMANVKVAVHEWFQRCHSHPDNVAIFYFCGHGIERDSQYLLMEDFGAFQPALLDNTLDLIAFHRGLAQCAAGTQLIFVDACREVPRKLKQLVTGTGQGLLDARLDGNLSRDAPILWAAAQGQQAFARKGESTQFTQALLEALRGAGAAPEATDGDRWSVRYYKLASTVGQLLKNAPYTGDRQEVRTGGEAGDALVHELDGPPSVPVHVAFDPEICAEITRLLLKSLSGGQTYNWGPAAGPCQLVALPDMYTLQAHVQAPYRADGPQKAWILPPLQRFTVKVEQSSA